MARWSESKTAQAATLLASSAAASVTWLALDAHARGVPPGWLAMAVAGLGPTLAFGTWWVGARGARLDARVGPIVAALREGRAPRWPADPPPDEQPVLDALEGLAARLSDERARLTRLEAAEGAGGSFDAGAALARLRTHVNDARAQVASLATAEVAGALDARWEAARGHVQALAVAARETPKAPSLAPEIEDTARSLDDLAGSIRDVAEGVDALSLIAEETSSSVQEMDVMVEQVRASATETVALAERAIDAAYRAPLVLGPVGAALDAARAEREAAAAQLAIVARAFAPIDEARDAAATLSERLELAALNASILASRAGEDADDLGALAAALRSLSTGASTLAGALDDGVAGARGRLAEVSVTPLVVRSDLAEARASFEAVAELTTTVAQRVRATLRAAEEQGEGSATITDAVGRIAEAAQQLAGVTEEQARGVALVVATVERLRVAVDAARPKDGEGDAARALAALVPELASSCASAVATRRDAWVSLAAGLDALDAELDGLDARPPSRARPSPR